jgi:hypothetical protein
MPNPRPTSWRVDLMSGSVIVAVVLGLLAAAYLLIQTFVGSIGWSRLVTRTSVKLSHKFAEMTPEERPQDPHMDGTAVCTENSNPDEIMVKPAEGWV